MESVERRLARIEDALTRVERTLARMNHDVENMQLTTQRMDNHISFVETVYRQVQRPFHALMNAASRSSLVGRGHLFLR